MASQYDIDEDPCRRAKCGALPRKPSCPFVQAHSQTSKQARQQWSTHESPPKKRYNWCPGVVQVFFYDPESQVLCCVTFVMLQVALRMMFFFAWMFDLKHSGRARRCVRSRSSSETSQILRNDGLACAEEWIYEILCSAIYLPLNVWCNWCAHFDYLSMMMIMGCSIKRWFWWCWLFHSSSWSAGRFPWAEHRHVC